MYCGNRFDECASEKVEHYTKCDIFIECKKCFAGQRKPIETCCINPDKIFVFLNRKDGKPTKREFCRNCGDTSAVIKMNPSNEYLSLPELTKEVQQEAQNKRFKRQRDFFEYLKNIKDEKYEQDNKEFNDKYHAYLKTKDWFSKRIKVLKRDNFICQACLENKATQVHHLTYDRVFNEPLFDLVSVCDPCHNSIHNIEQPS